MRFFISAGTAVSGWKGEKDVYEAKTVLLATGTARKTAEYSGIFRSWKAVASATVRSATHSFIVAGRWASWEMRTMPSMNLASFCL